MGAGTGTNDSNRKDAFVITASGDASFNGIVQIDGCLNITKPIFANKKVFGYTDVTDYELLDSATPTVTAKLMYNNAIIKSYSTTAVTGAIWPPSTDISAYFGNKIGNTFDVTIANQHASDDFIWDPSGPGPLGVGLTASQGLKPIPYGTSATYRFLQTSDINYDIYSYFDPSGSDFELFAAYRWPPGTDLSLNNKNIIDVSDIYFTNNAAIIGEPKAITISGAFEQGHTNVSATGDYSHAEGYNTTASGKYSHAEGAGTKAGGEGSHAEANATEADGNYSHTEGDGTKTGIIPGWTSPTDASGSYAHAEGQGSEAMGTASHAEGKDTKTYGDYSHTEGNATRTFGLASHAEGTFTTASGDYSHTEGSGNITYKIGSHAEGRGTTADGDYSHTEGDGTKTTGTYAHAEGQSSTAMGTASHAEGKETNASGSYSHAEGLDCSSVGIASHAEGRQTEAIGHYSHAEGWKTTTIDGLYSHAEGRQTTASGLASHAEGHSTLASGNYSHTEGYQTEATGHYSHAEGDNTTASGIFSHAEGNFTSATGDYAHAEGRSTVAYNDYMWAGGQYNKETNTYSTSVNFVVGAGTGTSNRKDAFVILDTGDASFNGNVIIDGSLTVTGNTTANYRENIIGAPTIHYLKPSESGSTCIIGNSSRFYLPSNIESGDNTGHVVRNSPPRGTNFKFIFPTSSESTQWVSTDNTGHLFAGGLASIDDNNGGDGDASNIFISANPSDNGFSDISSTRIRVQANQAYIQTLKGTTFEVTCIDTFDKDSDLSKAIWWVRGTYVNNAAAADESLSGVFFK